MQPVLPPTVVIEDFGWQNKHPWSILYYTLKRLGNLGTRPAFLVQCVCCFLLVNQEMYGHTWSWSVTFLPFRHSVLISVKLPLQMEVQGTLWWTPLYSIAWGKWSLNQTLCTHLVCWLFISLGHTYFNLCFLDPVSHIFSIMKKCGPVFVRGKPYLA